MSELKLLKVREDLIINEAHIVRARTVKDKGELIVHLRLADGESVNPITGEDAEKLWNYLTRHARSLTPKSATVGESIV